MGHYMSGFVHEQRVSRDARAVCSFWVSSSLTCKSMGGSASVATVYNRSAASAYAAIKYWGRVLHLQRMLPHSILANWVLAVLADSTSCHTQVLWALPQVSLSVLQSYCTTVRSTYGDLTCFRSLLDVPVPTQLFYLQLCSSAYVWCCVDLLRISICGLCQAVVQAW